MLWLIVGFAKTSAKAPQNLPNGAPDAAGEVDRASLYCQVCSHWVKQLLLGRAETIHEFLPISYDFSIRVQRALNVDPQGSQQAALRLGHRGGLVNAQRFLQQVNCLLTRAVERLDKLLHTLASLRESLLRH